MAIITLTFSHDTLECRVDTNIEGLLAANRVTYAVEWFDENSFTLYSKQGKEVSRHYNGTISDDKLTLEILNSDKVVITAELIRIGVGIE